MKRVSTYCRICEPQCALVAEIEEDNPQKIRLLPDKSHPVHKGFACHKGLNFTELHFDEDRLNYPQTRTTPRSRTPEFNRTPWDIVTSEAAERIHTLQERYGSDALGMYIGNPSAFNSTGRDAARRFATAIGVKYRFSSGTQDCSNKFAASEAVYGTANLHPIPDFKHTDYFLNFGCNPRISHVSFVHMTDPMGAIRGIVERGGTVHHINPRQIESSTPATGDVIQIKPDTDVYFLAALIHEIKVAGLEDTDWIARHSIDDDRLFEFCARYSAERVAGVVGIDAATIRTLAREFATAPSASLHMSTGVNMGRQGTLAYWLVQMLSLVSGNLGRRGGNIYSPGYFPAATVGKPNKEDPFFDTPFGDLRTIAGSLPGNLLADHIEAGLIKGLICMSGNPLLSMAGEKRLSEALEKLELLVVIDIYPNATSRYADFVLPATDWLERADINSVSLGFQPDPYVQYTEAVTEPLFERRPEWWIFGKLLQNLGLPSILDTPGARPLDRMDRQLAASELTMDEIKSAPGQTITLPEPRPEDTFDIGVQLEHIACFPWLIQQGVDSCETQFQALEKESSQTLKLISLRTNYMVNSWLHNLPSLKRDHALDNPLHIHPEDLSTLGLEAGLEVSVTSDYGQVIATLQSDDTLRPGVVAMTHGWGHGNNPSLSLASNHPGTNVNAILPTGPGSFDPLSNMSHMTGIPVHVQAVT